MTEQELAAFFKGYAEEIDHHRAELVSLLPEAAELCGPLDELSEYLENWSKILRGQRFRLELSHL